MRPVEYVHNLIEIRIPANEKPPWIQVTQVMLRELPGRFTEAELRIQIGDDSEPPDECARVLNREDEKRRHQHGIEEPRGQDPAPPVAGPKKCEPDRHQR